MRICSSYQSRGAGYKDRGTCLRIRLPAGHSAYSFNVSIPTCLPELLMGEAEECPLNRVTPPDHVMVAIGLELHARTRVALWKGVQGVCLVWTCISSELVF